MRTQREEESIERVQEALKNILNINTTKKEYQYDGTDLSATGVTGVGLIEVKERLLNYPEFINYLNEGLILEKKKYDELIENNGLYLNYFDFKFCQVILIWDARKIDLSTLKKKWCKQSTEFENKKYVLKDVYYTYLNNTCVRLINYNGEWERISIDKIYQKLNNLMEENN